MLIIWRSTWFIS